MNKVFAGQFVRQCKAVIDDKEILKKFQVLDLFELDNL